MLAAPTRAPGPSSRTVGSARGSLSGLLTFFHQTEAENGCFLNPRRFFNFLCIYLFRNASDYELSKHSELSVLYSSQFYSTMPAALILLPIHEHGNTSRSSTSAAWDSKMRFVAVKKESTRLDEQKMIYSSDELTADWQWETFRSCCCSACGRAEQEQACSLQNWVMNAALSHNIYIVCLSKVVAACIWQDVTFVFTIEVHCNDIQRG